MATTRETGGAAQNLAPGGVGRPAPAEAEQDFTVTLNVEGDYTQTVDFGMPGVPALVIDEPPPLGAGAGPNPARLLASAVGGCLAASLTFCMRKARLDVRGVRTTVRGTLVRNERGRLRIGGLHVRLEPVVPADQHDRVPRCLDLFEEFCVVTASVRLGVPTTVEVEPASA
jgi:organic hydroperoxide reductase OsmC/OhrA